MIWSARNAAAQRWLLVMAALTFALYCGNVVTAKVASLAGTSIPLLPDVAAFLLLLAATGLFISYALCRETVAGGEHEFGKEAEESNHQSDVS